MTRKILYFFTLLFLLDYFSYASDLIEENICYSEKKYCKRCDHYHYKHYHNVDLSNFDKLKGILKLDYSSSNIGNSTNKSKQVIPLNEILQKIEQNLNEINRHASRFKVKIILSENDLDDKDVKELIKFINKNSLLCNHLVKLDLSNNQITEKSFKKLDCILQACTNLKIDISFNPINLEDFSNAFNGKNVKFKAY